MTRFVFITGGVVSSLGKGLAAEADGTTGHYGSEASPDGPLPTS